MENVRISANGLMKFKTIKWILISGQLIIFGLHIDLHLSVSTSRGICNTIVSLKMTILEMPALNEVSYGQTRW